MTLSSHIEGGIAVLTPVGRLDFASSGQLEQTASALITGGTPWIALDLLAVDYVSSAGLRAMLVTAKAAQAAGGGIAVFGLQPGVAEIFNTSGFGQVVTITATIEEARGKLGAWREAQP